ncbi:S8 family serine peptidase [Parahaliea maris]|uniref:S8 family serine peptidase n=1 Tax=Parahaliea maris TaxID=2716870 RepID=A0A5C9A6H1_9GAMM|nr:S8 family serine peptidase [Parahaliea maris]TXS96543.1 S8 family serine peptidase [Parahaliea maris]
MRSGSPFVWILSLVLCGASAALAAPGDVGKATRKAQLRNLVEQLQERDREDRQRVAALARQLGIPLRRELPQGGVLELRRVTPSGKPVFYTTYNVDAADTVSTDEVWPGGSAGLLLTGSGMRIGEWDGGAVLGEHPDLYPRVTQVDGSSVISNHSTHVAGTLIGAGTAQRPEARGMAYEALLDAYDWIADSTEMAAAAADELLLSNHSYGIAAGWIYWGGTGPDEWWWIGGADPGDTEDANFGYYDTETALWDQIAYDAPYYLMVKAAGNDRWDVGPDLGQEYSVVDPNGQLLSYSTAPRPADCAPEGYDCMPTVSGAKNILTIGSVDDVIGGYLPLAGAAGVQVSSFSGFGPTDDGRIKPDLMGNGWLLMSTYGQDPYFAAALGTSMAAPNVTGSLALLQEHYENLNGSGQFMRAATLKALAIHTADETGPAPGPDYQYGWGLLNTRKAAAMISDAGGGSEYIVENNLAPGATDTIPVEVTAPDAILKVTLVWTDPPGTPVPPALDPVDLMLVNDLDLRVSGPSGTLLPWTLDPVNPNAPAAPGDNIRDNVEQVQAEVTAGSYAVSVSHKGALQGAQPQGYSVLISVLPPPPVSSGYAIDEDFSGGMPAGWSVETTAGRDWQVVATGESHPEHSNSTGGGGGFAILDNWVGGQYAWTDSSLITPALDLSASTSVVLTFNSFYIYDIVETYNVETSADGGLSWINVWRRQGFGNIPTVETIDVSGTLAGASNAKFRFRFESGYLGPDGEQWQVDNVRLETYGGPVPPPDPPDVTLPGQAINPAPVNGAVDVPADTLLSWSSGQYADGHEVYLGTAAPLTAGDWHSSQTTNTYDPDPLEGETTYYWRVDETNTDGTTLGVTWSFTTAVATEPPPDPDPDPDPLSMHIGDLDADRVELSRNRWQAVAYVSVHDQDDLPLAGVSVQGSWGGAASGSGTCDTLGNGRCEVSKPNLKANTDSASFTVTSLTHSDGRAYLPAANHDPDGDSDGAVLLIPRTPDSGPVNTPPTLAITAPAAGTGFSSGASVIFSGTAGDAEDGDLSAFLSWSSSLDGALGTGSTVVAASLSDGSHVVSASVTDSGGETAVETVSISVGTPAAGAVHVGALSGSGQAGARGRWSGTVSVTLHTASHGNPGSGAQVSGSWSGGASGSGSCTTDASGQCDVSFSNAKGSAVTFTVDDVAGSGLIFDASASHVLSVEVIKP